MSATTNSDTNHMNLAEQMTIPWCAYAWFCVCACVCVEQVIALWCILYVVKS